MPGGIQAVPDWPIQVGNNIITGTTTPWDWGSSGDNGWTAVANKWSYDNTAGKFRSGTRSLKFDATKSGSPARIEQTFPWPAGNVTEISCWVQMTKDYNGEFHADLDFGTEHSPSAIAARIKIANATFTPEAVGTSGIANGTYDFAVSVVHPNGTEYPYTKRTSVVLSGGNDGVKVLIPDNETGGHYVYAGSEGGTLYRVISALDGAGDTTHNLYAPFRTEDSVHVDAIPSSGPEFPSGDWAFMYARAHQTILHRGEAVDVGFKAAGSVGQLWVDDVQVREIAFPLEIALPDRWWGYIFEDDDIDAVEVEVNVNERYVADQAGLSDNDDVKVVIQVLDAGDQSVLATGTIDPMGAGVENRQSPLNLSALAIGQEVLIRGELQKISDSSVLKTFPDTKLIKQSISFRNSINSYIDYRTHTWVLNQRKRFLWGAYATVIDPFSRKPFANSSEDNYEEGFVGFMDYPADTRGNLFDSMRKHHFNAWHNYINMQFVDIRPGAGDEITPCLKVIGNTSDFYDPNPPLKPRGIAFSQHTLEHFLWRKGGKEVSTWFGEKMSPPTNNSPAWAFWGQEMGNRKWVLGWYFMDEPGPRKLKDGMIQYLELRDASVDGSGIPGGVAWGVAVELKIMDPMFRYNIDAGGPDIYPLNNAPAAHRPIDDHYSSRGKSDTAPPGFAACNYATTNKVFTDSFWGGKKPVWVILQSFAKTLALGFPTYTDMMQQCLGSIAGGAKGIWWWQFGHLSIMRDHLFGTVTDPDDTGVNTDGSGTSFSGDLSASSGFLTDVPGNTIAIDAGMGIPPISGGDDERAFNVHLGSTKVAEVQSWTVNTDATLTLVGIALNCTGGTVNIYTGNWTINFSPAPSVADIKVFTIRAVFKGWQDLIEVSDVVMNRESVITQNQENGLVTVVEGETNGTGTASINSDSKDLTISEEVTLDINTKITLGGETIQLRLGGTSTTFTTWNVAVNTHGGAAYTHRPGGVVHCAWPHPHDPGETEIILVNNQDIASSPVTVTLDTAAPVGGIVEVYTRSSAKGHPSPRTISLDGTRKIFTDTLAGYECVWYIVRRSTARVGTPTDTLSTDAGLLAM